jgi:hypothetical protein
MALPKLYDRVLTRCGLLGRVIALVDLKDGSPPVASVILEADGTTKTYPSTTLEVISSGGRSRA